MGRAAIAESEVRKELRQAASIARKCGLHAGPKLRANVLCNPQYESVAAIIIQGLLTRPQTEEVMSR